MKSLKIFRGTDEAKLKEQVNEWIKQENLRDYTINKAGSSIEKLLGRPEGQPPEIVFTVYGEVGG